MCGINGFIMRENSYFDTEKHIREMNRQIHHRGPDDDGFFCHGNIAIGMQRLSIIDLGTGHQPIFNEDDTKAIVFNGEIYNYIQLRDKLIEKGHIFSTNSDTEVILHGYEEYGKDVFKMLKGMFAIAIYDIKQKIIILARDRAGQKPLYLYEDCEKVIFASEIKSIVNVFNIKKEIDKTALNLYLGLSYIPSPYTIYKGIKKIVPGTITEITASKLNEEHFWKLKIGNNIRSDYNIAKRELRKKLEKAVESQMVSDVPIGAFLSGGIDSSTIVGLMAQKSATPIQTFSIGFKDSEYDESDKAEIVARYNNTIHHKKILDYDDALIFLDKLLDSFDEPFADASALPTYYVSEFARQHVKVVLTGDAGDELFGGYSKYLIGYYSDKYRRVPKCIRRKVIEPLVAFLPDNKGIIRKVKKVIRNEAIEDIERHLNLMKLGFHNLEELLKKDYYDATAFDHVYRIYNSIGESTLMKSLYTDFKVVLEGDMLCKVDRMSMLNSLETRTPLLDEEVVDFAFSIPDHFKINGKEQKIILKESFKDILPSEIFNQAKQGFGVPIAQWFRGPLRARLYEIIDEDFIKRQNIFDYETIKKIVDEHMALKENRGFELWILFVFQHWYKRYFEK